MNTELSLACATDKYTPIPRLSHFIPFGYKEDENDPTMLQPVLLELEALEAAKDYLERYSYRVVRDWLVAVTGRNITHQGLASRIKLERTRDRKAKALRKWAARQAETMEKIRKLEQDHPGSLKK
jgi:hypothetical protein